MLAALVAGGATLAVLSYGGALRAAQDDALGIDVGSTPWLLPLARVSMEAAAVVTVGCLVAAAFFVPGEREGQRLRVGATARGWIRGASASALVWAVATVATMSLTLSDLLGAPVAEAVNPGSLTMLATSIDQGRVLATVLALALIVTVACWYVRTVGSAALVALLAVLATLPPAFGGHAAGTANHQLAVSAMLLHVGAAVLWTGGLLALLLGRRRPAKTLALSVARFSRLALCCFVAVALTGLASAALRMSAWSQFDTGYGAVVLLKLAALLALGGFGWWHRRVSIPALVAGRRSTFTRIASVEVLVMAAAVGLAAGLSRTPPPDDAHEAAVIETPIRSVLNWLPDPVFCALALVAIGCYLVGVRRLRRSGGNWPLTWTASWVAGWVVVGLATDLQLARAGEGTFLLMEKVQHVAIAVGAPVLLVSGGGVALALRTLRPASEVGMRGPREWLIAMLDSRALGLLSHPAAALALYAALLHGVYASALYTLSLRSHAGHLVLFAAALLIGGLFSWPLAGVHPGRRELPYAVRVALLLSATLLQALAGIALARDTPLISHSVLWAGVSALLVAGVWIVYRTDQAPGSAAAAPLQGQSAGAAAAERSPVPAGHRADAAAAGDR